MRKSTFDDYMISNSKYIYLQFLEEMTCEQRQEYRKAHNPWVIWNDSEGGENCIKLDEALDARGNIDFPMW